MPKSRVRKKTVYVPPADVRPPANRKRGPSPRWLPITAVVLLVVGVTWLVVYYLSQGSYPLGAGSDHLPGMADIGAFNLAVGFGFLVAALAVLTRWR